MHNSRNDGVWSQYNNHDFFLYTNFLTDPPGPPPYALLMDNTFYVFLKSHGRKAIQGDQLYMAVGFWYLVKRYLSSVRYCIVATVKKCQCLQGTRKPRPCLFGRVEQESRIFGLNIPPGPRELFKGAPRPLSCQP